MERESASPMRTVPLEVVPAVPSQVTVNLADGEVMAANEGRRGAVFVNVSTGRVSFAIGTTAVLDMGITLYPQGVWEMDERTFTKASIRAVGSANGLSVSVQEFD